MLLTNVDKSQINADHPSMQIPPCIKTCTSCSYSGNTCMKYLFYANASNLFLQENDIIIVYIIVLYIT